MTTRRLLPPPTARLSFRELTPDDLDDMAALLGDPEVMRYYPRTRTREESLRWIESSQRSYAEHGHGLWALTVRETGQFAGNCGLTRQPVEDEVLTEVGYLVPAALQGRGYATEAALACRDLARDVLKVDRLISIIHPDNVPSQRVAEKLGLTRERTALYHGLPRSIYSTTFGEG
ncbi:GNAT family N-acetyltransferase [Nonomuraea rhodomycinica]|uniref:GNAT family N-acetyltransferase n=1 Tax=Nonomuraea rhodomycinica TaxID=1712872 RepID=A0A7Y6MFA3_9ACTN|nr:GNAT family N-acetyltransferase [Nonomuraea rhodomycinica]NUW46488.1 GNAT family N-acetyltransferase [Nonomuraea rhodomycinica]